MPAHRLAVLALAVLAMLTAAPLAADPAADAPDRLAEALDAVGLDRAALGSRPKTWWSRFGHYAGTQRIPYFFPDLFAEPLRTYETSRVMAGALEHFLAPAYRGAHDDGPFKAAYYLGFTHLSPAHRGYGAGVRPLPEDLPDPLVAAVRELHRLGGGQLSAVRRDSVRVQAARLPAGVRAPLARLLWGLGHAQRWTVEAFEGVSAEDQAAVLAQHPAHDIGYSPALRRASAAADLILLNTAAQQVLQAASTAHRELSAAVTDAGDIDIRIVWATPLGRIMVTGTGPHLHGCKDCLAVVDLGGDDTYGPVAGASPTQRIAAVVDLSGNDRYGAGAHDDDIGTPAQGAGLFGVGLLWDGGGDDTYDGARLAQGAGYFGAGILWDEGAGNDSYRARFSAQGAGVFGLGLLVDGGGDDSYYLWGDGQGFGGPGGGIGVLADASGDDDYTAEQDARISGRGSMHSGRRVTSSNAQGAGIGVRRDGGDPDAPEGYSWAGGLGALIDLAGDDTRRAGNWALGSGYWFGTGLVYDGGGHDSYEAVYYSMASGAHFCIGAIYDDGDGDDRYRLVDPPLEAGVEPTGMNAAGGAGLAFGWDYTMGILMDRGGNDHYEARMIGGAQAMIRSTAILADFGDGDDTYVLPAAGGGGNAPFRDGYARDVHPHEISYGPYSHHGSSFGLLLDTGGTDRYLEFAADGQHQPSSVWRDGATWMQPPLDSDDSGLGAQGVGMDVDSGTIPELEVFAPLPKEFR